MKAVPAYVLYNTVSVTKVTIPKTVKTIRNYAFYGCEDLKRVVFKGAKKQWKKIAIEDYNDPVRSAKKSYKK